VQSSDITHVPSVREIHSASNGDISEQLSLPRQERLEVYEVGEEQPIQFHDVLIRN
jgi:hypothetical protein